MLMFNSLHKISKICCLIKFYYTIIIILLLNQIGEVVIYFSKRLHKNCLAKVNDNHPKPALALASQKWVGEIYSVDEQCVIAQGKGSYM
jgi:hypothetical protein